MLGYFRPSHYLQLQLCFPEQAAELAGRLFSSAFVRSFGLYTWEEGRRGRGEGREAGGGGEGWRKRDSDAN